ncbi:MAG: cyclohexa-1,5-dienecarbonyl-CoA hydratase [Planctomycetes bacterium]|nr:cyclohexa-1,5-dienecarbonyl-CoA hydratase [Planctomycetota bacterium]
MHDGAAATDVVRCEVLEDGALWHVVLATPKANIIDSAKIAALQGIFERARDARDLKAILIEGDGPHFSFGASIDEHMPERCAAMLASLHAMLKALLAANVVCMAAVRGQCLGGGLEIVSLCQRVFAAHDAKLGQPEIVLGVFAPVASISLPERVGRAVALDLLSTGRSMAADEALQCGLVDAVVDDPRAAAIEYVRRHLAPKSAASLRFAVRAARHEFGARFAREIDALEHIYLSELMRTADAVEGLTAFTQKRAPKWRNA